MKKTFSFTLIAIAILLALPISVHAVNDTTTYYLSNASVGSCSPGPCRQLVTTAGTADTTTTNTARKGSIGSYMIEPDTSSSAEGTPSTSTPASLGWILDTNLGAGVASGTWSVDMTIASSAVSTNVGT